MPRHAISADSPIKVVPLDEIAGGVVELQVKDAA
jgi:hypothetical protein